MMGRRRLQGVGLDLISLARTRRFLKTHSRDLCEKLLTELEALQWRAQKYSTKLFSRFLTAKEAYFKALDKSWMGLEGFRALEVSCLPGGRFKVQSLECGPSYQADGRFFGTKKFTGAHVTVWQAR